MSDDDVGQLARDDAVQKRVCCESILQRVEELEQENARLKAHLNSLCAACRLPPEILAKIFVELTRYRWPFESKPGVWVQITWVCRRWRDVALDCAALWTTLPFFNPQFTRLAFERSKNALLTVDFSANGPRRMKEFTPTLQTIMASAHRLQDVKIEFPRGYCELSANRIVSPFESDDQHSDPSNDEHACRFLTGEAPHLQHLSMTNHCVPSSEISFPATLTVLVLVGTDRKRPRFSSLDSLLTTLRHLPALERISLENVLPLNYEADFSGPKAVLPSLETMYLKDDPERNAHLFQHIEFPTIGHITLVAASTNLNSSSIRRLFLGLCKALSASPSTSAGVTRLSLAEKTYEMHHEYSEFHLMFAKGDFSPYPDLWIYFKSDVFIDATTVLLNTLNVQSLKRLSISEPCAAGHEWTVELWRSLGQLPHLESICFDRQLGPFHSLAEALDTDPILKSHQSQSHTAPSTAPSLCLQHAPLFAALKSIEYTCTDCSCQSEFEGGLDTIPRLVRAVQGRAALGLTPPRLWLTLTDDDCLFQADEIDYDLLDSIFHPQEP